MQAASLTFVTAGTGSNTVFAAYVDSILVKTGTGFSVDTLMSIVKEQGLDNVAVNYNQVKADRFFRTTCFSKSVIFTQALSHHFSNINSILD